MIQKESAKGVVLDLGMGSTTIAASTIDHIDRSYSAADDQTRKIWRTTYIPPADLPADLHPIMTGFDRLKGMWESALNSAKEMPVAIRRLGATRKQLAQEQKNYRKLSARLASMSVKDDVDSYNRTVEENNRMVSKVNQDQSRITKPFDLSGLLEAVERILRVSSVVA